MLCGSCEGRLNSTRHLTWWSEELLCWRMHFEERVVFPLIHGRKLRYAIYYQFTFLCSYPFIVPLCTLMYKLYVWNITTFLLCHICTVMYALIILLGWVLRRARKWYWWADPWIFSFGWILCFGQVLWTNWMLETQCCGSSGTRMITC